MQAALADGAIEPAQLSLVSANGSSSVFYDALEASAIRAVFCESMPVYSMKGALGQTGAVTPVLQTIAAVQSLSTAYVPPTINCEELDPKCEPLNLIRSRVELRPEFVMTHAIGFGGYYYAATTMPHRYWDGGAEGRLRTWSQGLSSHDFTRASVPQKTVALASDGGHDRGLQPLRLASC